MSIVRVSYRNLDPAFGKRLQRLEKDWQPVANAAVAFAETQLVFAKKLRTLWEEAKEYDKEAETDEHKQAVKQRLYSLIKTTDESVFSRWQTIGQYADQLQPHAASLPPIRDSLHVLAQAAKEQAPIGQWIRQKKLTNETSFQEVKLLRQEAKTGKTVQRKKSKAKEQRIHKITLGFSGDVSSTEIARLLTELVQSNLLVKISSDASIRQGLKSVLKEGFSIVEEKYHG
jgi:hypothetical protein